MVNDIFKKTERHIPYCIHSLSLYAQKVLEMLRREWVNVIQDVFFYYFKLACRNMDVCIFLRVEQQCHLYL